MNKKRSGFVAVVGRPNVGKSSIMNAIVGMKVSITGPKAQTTRNKILGIKTTNEYQIVFVDTPGAIKPTNKLGEYMKKSIDSATEGIDLLMLVLDGTNITDADYKLLEQYLKGEVPVFVVINKTDIASFEKVYPKLEKLNEYKEVAEFVSVSAKTGKNIDLLIDKIVEKLPEGEFLYDKNDITDRPVKFLAAEIIREKALLYLQDEIPHGIAVEIMRFTEGKKIVTIEADVIATKENHKQIVIGKKGDMLKKIGTSARGEIEELLDAKVNLKLFVKVRENWQDNLVNLRDLGYDKKNL